MIAVALDAGAKYVSGDVETEAPLLLETDSEGKGRVVGGIRVCVVMGSVVGCSVGAADEPGWYDKGTVDDSIGATDVPAGLEASGE